MTILWGARYQTVGHGVEAVAQSLHLDPQTRGSELAENGIDFFETSKLTSRAHLFQYGHISLPFPNSALTGGHAFKYLSLWSHSHSNNHTRFIHKLFFKTFDKILCDHYGPGPEALCGHRMGKKNGRENLLVCYKLGILA